MPTEAPFPLDVTTLPRVDALKDEPSVAGVSGGRTSALMAHMLSSETTLCFQNTGLEHERTLDFICRLEDDLRRPIVRLEWRPPPEAAAPRFATFEVVTHETMSRKGEPFHGLLSSLRSYRATKDKGPIAPWARQRVCTAYLKMRTEQAYMRSLGHGEYTRFVGLRFDEPARVHRLMASARKTIDPQCPLYDFGITKRHVMRFWQHKNYDLGLPEHLGNCVACFMKDERDLASALMDPSVDAAFWIGIEEEFGPMRRGRTSYREVLEEAPARMAIRAALQRGEVVPLELSPKRQRLVVLQEKRAKSEDWSCSCEAAMVHEDEEYDEAVIGA